jgi:hypothetical protein
MDIFEELNEIGRMINNATMLSDIRKAVASVKGSEAIVTDGVHHPRGRSYDVVVSSTSDMEMVCRRIGRDVPEATVTKITSDLLGIKTARRGSIDSK